LDICRENGVFTIGKFLNSIIGIVNVVGSLIATSVHCGTYLNIGREVAVPATKSFTA
jgi:glucosamine 6-phosphate synthetase-like amidotransferase/phosphosugar isomerase protein